MKKLKQTLATLACLLLIPLLSYSQSITPSVNGADVDYRVVVPTPGTHVFTLFGDGNYSMLEQPTHHFDKTGSFKTEAYFLEPYKTNPPAKVTTNTNIALLAGSYKKYSSRMSGEIDIFYSWCPSSGMENYYILAFTNRYSTTPIDGCIDFHWHTNDLTMNYGGIRIYNDWVYNEQHLPSTRPNFNQKLQWDFKDLKQYERRYVYIPAEVLLSPKSNLNLFTSYATQCQAHSGDGNSSSSSSSGGGASKSTSTPVRKFPVDPNGKHVYPECLNPYTPEPIKYLEYEINFFNDGDGAAHNVVLIDDLSPWLNPSTFVLLDSEYEAQVHVHGNQIRIEYPGINLPGKKEIKSASPYVEYYSEEEYSTYLSFGICTYPIDPSTACIKNKASIYFDSNPAVDTKVAVTCVTAECPIDVTCSTTQYRKGSKNFSSDQHSSLIDQLKVWPNPFDEDIGLTFELNAKIEQAVRVDILNTQGVVQRSLQFEIGEEQQFNTSLSLDELPSGLYFLTLYVDGEQRIERIMKY